MSAERLQEVLQSAGYRVTVSEQNGMVQLLSASQGVGFAARMGSPALPEGQFLDYTLSCALRVQGELPAGLAERWSVEKRFARLTVQGAFLVLELDVIVAGGVSEIICSPPPNCGTACCRNSCCSCAPTPRRAPARSRPVQESLSEAQAESAAEPTTQGPRAAPGPASAIADPVRCPPLAASAASL